MIEAVFYVAVIFSDCRKHAGNSDPAVLEHVIFYRNILPARVLTYDHSFVCNRSNIDLDLAAGPAFQAAVDRVFQKV